MLVATDVARSLRQRALEAVISYELPRSAAITPISRTGREAQTCVGFICWTAPRERRATSA